MHSTSRAIETARIELATADFYAPALPMSYIPLGKFMETYNLQPVFKEVFCFRPLMGTHRIEL